MTHAFLWRRCRGGTRTRSPAAAWMRRARRRPRSGSSRYTRRTKVEDPNQPPLLPVTLSPANGYRADALDWTTLIALANHPLLLRLHVSIARSAVGWQEEGAVRRRHVRPARRRPGGRWGKQLCNLFAHVWLRIWKIGWMATCWYVLCCHGFRDSTTSFRRWSRSWPPWGER